MGKCSTTVRQIRFVIEDELTHCYVAVDAMGDCPLGVQGWHHKAFGSSKSCLDILRLIKEGKEEFMLWAQGAPKL